MTTTAGTEHRLSPLGAASEPAPAARRAARSPRISRVVRIVALIDGGAGDTAVVDDALARCLSGGRELRLIHMYGPAEAVPTPWDDSLAQEYARGALAVANLVPGLPASVVCFPWVSSGALRRELIRAEALFAPVARSAQMAEALRPVRARGHRCRIVTSPDTPAESVGLRLGYRLALQVELERQRDRPDAATSPEALDDAWHVGIASPPLSTEVLRAWSVCAAWPPPTLPTGVAPRRTW